MAKGVKYQNKKENLIYDLLKSVLNFFREFFEDLFSIFKSDDSRWWWFHIAIFQVTNNKFGKVKRSSLLKKMV